NIHNNVPSYIKRLEYDPNRSSFIALLRSVNGIYSYMIAPSNVSIGDVVYSFSTIPEIITFGSNSILKYMPAGSIIYNIETFPGMGSII
ncbi:50S ribosomal protein L2, partial [Escherichia coli]|nr:50S ribosomal protein L2 [Escherichia coli]